MTLEVLDRTVTIFPDRLLIDRFGRERLGAQDLGMNTDDEHFFVIGAVENPDPAPLRQAARGPPKKVVVELFRARMFEAENFAALRIDPRHDVLDRAVFAGRVHRLEDEEEGVAIVGIKQALQLAQFLHLAGEHLTIMRFGFIEGLDRGWRFGQTPGAARFQTEFRGIHFHDGQATQKEPPGTLPPGGNGRGESSAGGI